MPCRLEEAVRVACRAQLAWSFQKSREHLYPVHTIRPFPIVSSEVLLLEVGEQL